MSDQIEELKNVADQLLVEAAINQIKVVALQKSFFELSSQLLKEDEFSKLKYSYYKTLVEKSNQQSSLLSDIVFHKKTALNSMFEFQSHLKALLHELK